MGKNKAASSSEKSALGDWGTPPKLMESVERVSALFINFVFGYPNTMLARRREKLGRKLVSPKWGAGEKLGFPCLILEQKRKG
ncbi:hypothetical protein [Lactococcus lactis]|jgi:hypothetical protein|uniref:Uncharacterized protein n=2 Tax=Lactococcus lactis TaxID=1358 RepID=A0A552Z7Y5_9LACT|nr:hypothetical protein [Lactococcus lactis]MBU3886374.1 hypothetical protein [Lactococcus lactis]MCT3119452.1 hypothetical protein [Lactococcus lactis]MDH8062326.1 hypothetical protein [Lactococcus lactis subsp. lactis]MDN6471838.1 hypothetical protein [Lactococcus lactis]MDN6546267.1 hypothetical protein [Lactococcus lactis]